MSTLGLRPARVKLLMRKRGRLELKRSHLVLPLGRFRICRETKRVDGAQGPSSSSERIVQQQRGGAPQRAASAFARSREHSVRSRTRRARGELAVLVLARGVDDVFAVGALQLRLRVAPTAKRGRDRTRERRGVLETSTASGTRSSTRASCCTPQRSSFSTTTRTPQARPRAVG